MHYSEKIEWHRADEVLPDDCETVLVMKEGEEEVLLGYVDGGEWRYDTGYLLSGALFWSELPNGPQP